MQLKQTSKNEGTLEGLEANGDGFWLTVGNASVYLKRTDEGLVVDIYAVDKEDEDSLVSCYAYDSELDAEEA